MAISLMDSLSIKKKSQNVARDSFATISDAVAFNENWLPSVFHAMLEDTGEIIVYNENNTDLGDGWGKWRKLQGASYNDAELRNKISDIETNIGDMSTINISSVTDLVGAINSLYSSSLTSVTYSGRKLTLTYTDGNAIDLDISSIITDTNIGDFSNVDDTGITDKQVLAYDIATNKYIPTTIDGSNVLSEAKQYTDEEILKINNAEAIAVDSKPTFADGTITYTKNGAEETTTNANTWFYYTVDTKSYQTIWVDSTEFTVEINGTIDFVDYVNKTTDVVSTYTGEEVDKTKIPDLAAIDALYDLVKTALRSKVNTVDIVDDLISEATDKPLSASQGKVLDEKITVLKTDVETNYAKKDEVTTSLDTKLDKSFTGDDVANKFLSTDDTGNVVLKEVSSIGGGTAETTTYANANYPSYTNVDLALDALFNKVYYVKPSITSFKMTPSTTTYEIGTKVDSLVFEWTVNKDILSQTLTGCTLADETVRTATYATQLSSNKTFTLSVNDGENSASASKTISFLNKIHWGSCVEPVTYDSAFILGLTNGKMTSSNKGDFSFNAGSGEYCYFAVPTSMKITSAWVNGFQADLQEVITVSHTNASGHTSDYTISRFGNTGLGSFVATVK